MQYCSAHTSHTERAWFGPIWDGRCSSAHPQHTCTTPGRGTLEYRLPGPMYTDALLAPAGHPPAPCRVHSATTARLFILLTIASYLSTLAPTLPPQILYLVHRDINPSQPLVVIHLSRQRTLTASSSIILCCTHAHSHTYTTRH